VPVLYYIVPQVWAWGADRLPKMASVITKAAVILPFEEELLRAHGIDARFVGHPLLDRIAGMPSRAAARSTLGVPDGARVLALFPGSRQQEIDRHLDDFVRTAGLLERAHPGLQVLVATAPGVVVPPERCPYRQVTESSLAVLRAADAAVCKSGTTTLEAAVAGCPLVVAYRTSRWTHAIARRVVRIPRIGLVNVVAGREVAASSCRPPWCPKQWPGRCRRFWQATVRSAHEWNGISRTCAIGLARRGQREESPRWRNRSSHDRAPA
jgi:lipid-A-disaccharide synthase